MENGKTESIIYRAALALLRDRLFFTGLAAFRSGNSWIFPHLGQVATLAFWSAISCRKLENVSPQCLHDCSIESSLIFFPLLNATKVLAPGAKPL
jgi:hypothetical protein